jgi:mannosyltransferase OCH1-like enzyme
MTDKERISRMIETLVRIKNLLGDVQAMSYQGTVVESLEEIKQTIEFVVQANADQIETPHYNAMTNEEIKQRIKEEAKEYFDRAARGDDGNEMRAYIRGAESEHTRAWNEAIDACIKVMWEKAKPDKLWTEYQSDFESLKR